MTFPAGETMATVQVPIILDNQNEPDEEFNLMIEIPSEARMLLSEGRVNTSVGLIKDSSGIHY